MGYGFTCNAQVAEACGGEYESSAPPFMGEFSERFIKTEDSPLVEKFEIGETVTICQDCAEYLFL